MVGRGGSRLRAGVRTHRLALLGLAAVALLVAAAGVRAVVVLAEPQLSRTTPQLSRTTGEVSGGGGPAANVAAAAAHAADRGVRTGIALLDLRTGQFYGAGDYSGSFGAASVVKILIAVRLLATGQLTGGAEALATAMIERSDDAAVATLWPLVGGPEVVDWVESHYQIPGIGGPGTKAGIWGNTQITAIGLVRLYRAIANDPVVGPWLMEAMRHATKTAADGTDQFFGIPAATTGFAVKQGWGARSADDPDNAIAHSTGYVHDGRYAVAILAEGLGWNTSTDSKGYNEALAGVVTELARLIMPGGRIQ